MFSQNDNCAGISGKQLEDLHMVSCTKIVLVSGRLFLLPKSCVSSMVSTD